MIGSPMVRFLSASHGKLKSLAATNLKILFTLMLCVALEKNSVAFISLAYALAWMREHKLPARSCCKMVIRIHQEQ